MINAAVRTELGVKNISLSLFILQRYWCALCASCGLELIFVFPQYRDSVTLKALQSSRKLLPSCASTYVFIFHLRRLVTLN